MSEPATPDAAPEIFYVLACRQCGDPDNPQPIPFGSAAERGKWASEHSDSTGHASWIVLDQPDQPEHADWFIPDQPP